jgi:hypothetical protein
MLAEGGGGSLYLPGEFDTFTPEDIAARSQFSKLEFASEQVRNAVVNCGQERPLTNGHVAGLTEAS